MLSNSVDILIQSTSPSFCGKCRVYHTSNHKLSKKKLYGDLILNGLRLFFGTFWPQNKRNINMNKYETKCTKINIKSKVYASSIRAWKYYERLSNNSVYDIPLAAKTECYFVWCCEEDILLIVFV